MLPQNQVLGYHWRMFFWEHETKQIIATDGSILRAEPMEFPLEESIQFEKKSMYPGNQESFQIDYIDNKETPYPNYKKVLKDIKTQDDLTALKMQSFNFEKLIQFQSSFVNKHPKLTLAFKSQLEAVSVYNKKVFVGLIMPAEIHIVPIPESEVKE